MSANFRPDLSEYGVVIPPEPMITTLAKQSAAKQDERYRRDLMTVLGAAEDWAGEYGYSEGARGLAVEVLAAAERLREAFSLHPDGGSKPVEPDPQDAIRVLRERAWKAGPPKATVLMPFTDVEAEEQCVRQAQAAQLNATITACLERVKATEDVRRMLDRLLHHVDTA